MTSWESKIATSSWHPRDGQTKFGHSLQSTRPVNGQRQSVIPLGHVSILAICCPTPAEARLVPRLLCSQWGIVETYSPIILRCLLVPWDALSYHVVVPTPVTHRTAEINLARDSDRGEIWRVSSEACVSLQDQLHNVDLVLA